MVVLVLRRKRGLPAGRHIPPTTKIDADPREQGRSRTGCPIVDVHRKGTLIDAIVIR